MKPILMLLLTLNLFACQSEQISWQKINTEIEENFADLEHISIDEFAAEKEDNDELLIIDVREPEEYAISHIPGAKNITNPDTIAKLALELEQEVVVYCSVGYRSAIVARKLQDRGVLDVSNLKGSIFAWANEDRPLVNKVGATKAVHPFDEYWGQLLDEDIPTNF